MDKKRRNVMICCVATLVCVLGGSLTGFALNGTRDPSWLYFIYRFFLIVTPVCTVLSIISVVRMRK